MAHEHDVYMLLSDAAVQRHDETAIRQYTPKLEELAIRDSHRLYIAIAQRAWGVAHRLAGEHAEAESRLNKALDLFSELGTRWQIGRTLIELAELDLARSDRAGARNYFSQALEAFEKLKASPDIERTRAALQALD
jgi:tetratricopeptide (TPR) repeat protein